MSPGEIETVRGVYDAFNRRDIPRFLGLLASEIEWRPLFADTVEGRAYRGHDSVREWLEELDESWDEFRAVPDEFRVAGHQVLVLGRLVAKGRGSSIAMEHDGNWVFDLVSGVVVSMRAYVDRAAALDVFGAG
jgi:ketosteroid isomerase-like protein